ncbi:hypothetical protein SLEP1_g60133 [Rubroshorea leprosula]|uniref:Uncharacterized protein n=1 Tax=Rubroshorea leprosula TaxID=152421 RepID=A0AAV5MVZ1_9ROSI|nr:hypothetical protein SLEP1_g60133 [Rubroshorea leprosula]
MLEPPCAPSVDDSSGSGDPRLYLADLVRCLLFLVGLQIRRWSPPLVASIGGGEREGSQIWQPCDPPAASRDRPPLDRVSASASWSLAHLPHG